MAEKDEKKDPFDGEYIGNIWGWKFSMLGLALIVLMSALMIYRHISLGVPFGEASPNQEQQEVGPAPDSLNRADTLRQ